MDTHTPEKIYNSYRLALSKQYGHRAAERRNRARKIVVQRYNISFQDLKKIINEYDLENNVTHEHDPQYFRELEYREAAQALEDEYKNFIGCPNCGNVEATDVETRVNPFEIEIYNELKPMYSCYECYYEVSLDI